jgi:hypothetical protein
MFDPPEIPESLMRTGHFVFQVWRKDDTAWSWRLRVEAVDTGAWGVFDSMQDALWFMREHMAVDQDAEVEALEPRLSSLTSRHWLDDLGEPTEPVG